MDLRNSRILLTGGAGFLGRRVEKRLRDEGCQNVFIPRSKDYDLVTEDGVRRALADSKADLVIHLAAVVGGIEANRANPGSFFYENAKMGIELIEQSRRAGVKKFVVVGTICAYPKFTPVPFKEENLWDGYPEETNAPYGLAKKMLLVQAQAYRQQYGFNVIYLLPVNLYGPHDNFDLKTSHVIPAMIRKFVEARDKGLKEVELWGTGKPTREFLYVEDAAEGIVLATKKYEGSEPVNLGSGEEIAISDLASLVSNLVGYKGSIVWNSDKPDGQPRRMLDTQKAEVHFGFKAATALEKGIQRTLDFYSQQASPANPS